MRRRTWETRACLASESIYSFELFVCVCHLANERIVSVWYTERNSYLSWKWTCFFLLSLRNLIICFVLETSSLSLFPESQENLHKATIMTFWYLINLWPNALLPFSCFSNEVGGDESINFYKVTSNFVIYFPSFCFSFRFLRS